MNYNFENNFDYHAPKEGQPKMYEAVRATLKEAAEFLDAVCPDSREKSLAFTKLEEAMFWANASIARTGHMVEIQEEEPVMVDEEAIIHHIHENTLNVDKDTIRAVLNAEAEYLTEIGVYQEVEEGE
jgi:hypothetical protein